MSTRRILRATAPQAMTAALVPTRNRSAITFGDVAVAMSVWATSAPPPDSRR